MAELSLRQLLQGITVVGDAEDVAVTGLQLDSRCLKPGDLFFAVNGHLCDGADFIEDALRRGAVAIVCEQRPETFNSMDVPLLEIPQLPAVISEIAARFYHRPSSKMSVIGVTGTDGKTSVTHLLAQALTLLGKKSALIGTLGSGSFDDLSVTTHTTPDAIETQRLLADFVQHNIEYVVMEVSSHGLDQARVAAVEFDWAVLTQFSRDHLDYHKNTDAYAAAKCKLFAFASLRAAVVNGDDDLGCRLAQQLSGRLPVYGYGFSMDMPPSLHGQVRGSDLRLSDNGINFNICAERQCHPVQSTLIGRFNAANLLAVTAVLRCLQFALLDIVAILSQVRAVPGRVQLLRGQHPAAAIVDYAHTPKALEAVLQSLREHTRGKLICVFGCGGDRDKGKRALMGRIAESEADSLFITDDNPRTESPVNIVDDIVAGMQQPQRATVIHNRKQAIQQALSTAVVGDVVLIAGKGHEPYQQVGTTRLAFSDIDTVRAALGGQHD